MVLVRNRNYSLLEQLGYGPNSQKHSNYFLKIFTITILVAKMLTQFCEENKIMNGSLPPGYLESLLREIDFSSLGSYIGEEAEGTQTPLFWILKRTFDPEAAKEYLRYAIETKGANINQPGANGQTAIFGLIKNHSENTTVVIDKLLPYMIETWSADPKHKDSFGRTCVFHLRTDHDELCMRVLRYLMSFDNGNDIIIDPTTGTYIRDLTGVSLLDIFDPTSAAASFLRGEPKYTTLSAKALTEWRELASIQPTLTLAYRGYLSTMHAPSIV